MTYRARSFQAPDHTSHVLPKRQGQREQLVEFLTRDGSIIAYERSHEHHRGVLRLQPSRKSPTYLA